MIRLFPLIEMVTLIFELREEETEDREIIAWGWKQLSAICSKIISTLDIQVLFFSGILIFIRIKGTKEPHFEGGGSGGNRNNGAKSY